MHIVSYLAGFGVILATMGDLLRVVPAEASLVSPKDASVVPYYFK